MAVYGSGDVGFKVSGGRGSAANQAPGDEGNSKPDVLRLWFVATCMGGTHWNNTWIRPIYTAYGLTWFIVFGP